jgi:hypothetical protein
MKKLFVYNSRRFQPIKLRHRDVGDDDIRFVLMRDFEHRSSILSNADDFKILTLKSLSDTLGQ